jgi:hypothetical protein
MQRFFENILNELAAKLQNFKVFFLKKLCYKLLIIR